MEEEITFIIFSMDSPGQTAECAKALKSRNIAIFYTSSDKDCEILRRMLPGARVIPAPGFGYPEPLRPWAESFVSTPYVFIIDTDERVSEGLASFIRSGRLEHDVYKIFREESTNKNGTWQTRLYKKGSIDWKGFVHEQPSNKSKKLPKDCIILHNDKSLKHPRTYNKLNSFMPQSTIEAIARSIAVGFILAGPKAVFYLPQTINDISRQKHLSTKEDKEIRNEIRKIGLVRYLGLDNPAVVSSIISKYGAVPHGTELLVKLMRERHSSRKN